MSIIIAMAGRKQSGKTSACEYIAKIFAKEAQLNSAVYNFADPLKQMCISIFGLTYEQCYGSDDQKNESVNCKWPDSGKVMSAREVMQYVGTNVFRKMQHNVWADATIRKIQDEKLPLALIADCRFPNEVHAIKNAGGLVIKLNRNLYNSSHESEIALDEDQYDSSNFDLVIDNRKLEITETHQLIKNYLQVKRVLPL
jgi:hypothetical protein